MNTVTDRLPAAALATPSCNERVPLGSALYNEVLQFLYDEARMLDRLELREWGATLAEDLRYGAPLRLTRASSQTAESYVRTVMHYHDDYRSVMGRIMRLTETRSAFAEDPPSRTRRLVTNVEVQATDRPDEFKVLSYLLVTRSRFDFDDFDLISAERHDLIRRTGGGLKLARREIQLDQAVLGTPNLGIFL